MEDKSKKSEQQLSAIIAGAISNSEHFTDGELKKERENVEKYYRGELPKPLHSGDSKYVSRDVFESVDSMRSTVLESFLAHNRIVFFRPEKGETVEDSKQATEYTRHKFFKENDGEGIMYDVLTDGLQKRYSVVKVINKQIKESEVYEFEGMTEDELTLTLEEHDDFEFEDLERSESGLYTGSFVVGGTKNRTSIEVLQPEDFLISSRASSIQDAKYVIHRYSKSKGDLLKEGYDESKVNKINFGGHNDLDAELEKQLRFEPVDDIIAIDDDYDPMVAETVIYEVYIKLDMNNDGEVKLWKIDYASGGVILSKEEVSRFPFASFVPLPVPHTFFGDNFAKAVIPVQNARTVLIRQIINHSLITNNPRMMVLNGTVQNPSELTANKVGGLVNVRRLDGLAPIPQAPMNPFVFNLIQMIDEDKEETTGISRLSQGLNKDAISTQNSEGMVEQLISQSQGRQKIIARMFGKFLRELFLLIYQTAVDHVDEDEFIDVTGDYVAVNPSEWVDRTAASIELTLGYGEQDREAQKWVDLDVYLAQHPLLSTMYTPENSYEVVTRAMETRGIEDAKTLLTPPEEVKPPEPNPMEVLQMEQMKSQIQLQQAQAQSMVEKATSDRMKAEADLLKAQTEAAIKKAEVELKEREFAHEKYMDTEELVLAQNTPEKRATFNLSN